MASQEPSPWAALLPGHDQKPLRMTSSPLHKRAEDGELLWVRTALDAGADVHDQGGLYGRTLLHVAASGNRLALARLLLDRGANPAAADMVRAGGVCCASCVHWESVLESQRCSDQPANARSSSQERGRTPLHDAVANGHAEVAQLLLSRHAPPDALDGAGWTPLLYAATLRRLDLCRLFISRGDCDLDVQPDDGVASTALHVACATDHTQLVAELVEAGAGTEVTDALGRTPLHRACRAGAADAVRVLITNGKADVNARSGRGWTPLMYAARWGSLPVVKLLLEANADVSITDPSGANALLLAHETSAGEHLDQSRGEVATKSDAGTGVADSTPEAVRKGAREVYAVLAYHGGASGMSGGVMGALLDMFGAFGCLAPPVETANETDTPSHQQEQQREEEAAAASRAAVEAHQQQEQQRLEEEQLVAQEEARNAEQQRAEQQYRSPPQHGDVLVAQHSNAAVNEEDIHGFSFRPGPGFAARPRAPPDVDDDAASLLDEATSSATELFTTIFVAPAVPESDPADDFQGAASDAQALFAAVIGDERGAQTQGVGR